MDLHRGGWTRTAGWQAALVQLAIRDPLGGSGGGGTPGGVVASVAACVPIVSRYNERVCLTRLGRGVILCLPCVCSPNNCHRNAPHRIASRRTAPYRIASHRCSCLIISIVLLHDAMHSIVPVSSYMLILTMDGLTPQT